MFLITEEWTTKYDAYTHGIFFIHKDKQSYIIGRRMDTAVKNPIKCTKPLSGSLMPWFLSFLVSRSHIDAQVMCIYGLKVEVNTREKP